MGLFLGLLLLAYPGYLGYRASKLPAISDITTDTGNPPRFDALARLRPRGRSEYPGAATARRAASGLSRHRAAARRRAAETGLRHRARAGDQTQMAYRRCPRRRRRRGAMASIEATARTPIMGFRDDVVIRVSPSGQGVARSICARPRATACTISAPMPRAMRSLLEDIDDAVGAAPEPRPEPEKKNQPAPKRPAAQAVNAVDRRRAVGLDHLARHQILQMRQHREAGRAVRRGSMPI